MLGQQRDLGGALRRVLRRQVDAELAGVRYRAISTAPDRAGRGRPQLRDGRRLVEVAAHDVLRAGGLQLALGGAALEQAGLGKISITPAPLATGVTVTPVTSVRCAYPRCLIVEPWARRRRSRREAEAPQDEVLRLEVEVRPLSSARMLKGGHPPEGYTVKRRVLVTTSGNHQKALQKAA